MILNDPKIFERLSLGTAVLTITRLSIIKQKPDMRIRADRFQSEVFTLWEIWETENYFGFAVVRYISNRIVNSAIHRLS